jgi:hypothetical protein
MQREEVVNDTTGDKRITLPDASGSRSLARNEKVILSRARSKSAFFRRSVVFKFKKLRFFISVQRTLFIAI